MPLKVGTRLGCQRASELTDSLQSSPHLLTAPGCTEEFDDGANTPVFVLPRLWTALFIVGDEPSVFADEPMLFPEVPWLFALPAFGPGEPPVPFISAPLLRVVPLPEEAPPFAAPGEPPAELPAAPAELPAAPPDPPPLPPPPPPPLCPKAAMGMIRIAISRILGGNDDMSEPPFQANAALSRAFQL